MLLLGFEHAGLVALLVVLLGVLANRFQQSQAKCAKSCGQAKLPHKAHAQNARVASTNKVAIETLISQLRANLYDDGAVVVGPWGCRKLLYADYAASGRFVKSIERYLEDAVIPYYGNTHTEANETGGRMGEYVEMARETIYSCLNADPSEYVVIFCGNGTTAAVHKLVMLLGLDHYDRGSDKGGTSDASNRPVVFLGPFEHHSNDLPWREKHIDLVRIPEDVNGQVDLIVLEDELRKYRTRSVKLCSMSAGSNLTGIVSQYPQISRIMHRNGGLAFFDFASAAAHVEMDMSGDKDQSYMDGVYLSPHKFIGGPGSPGVLVVRRAVLKRSKPTAPGGGTVTWVLPTAVRYENDVEVREEAGTPNIVGIIRCGLAFQLRQQVGMQAIIEREHRLTAQLLQKLKNVPNLYLLGGDRAAYHAKDRLGIMSFFVLHQEPKKPSVSALHPQFIATLLNDLYGIQARAGCMCAGPYALSIMTQLKFKSALNAIDIFTKDNDQVQKGFKFGFVRISLGFTMTAEEVDFIASAVAQVAEHGWKLLPFYVLDAATGTWQHRLHKKHFHPPAVPFHIDHGSSGVHKSSGATAEKLLSMRECLEQSLHIYENAVHEHKGGWGVDYLGNRRLAPEMEAARWFPLPSEALRSQGRSPGWFQGRSG